MISKEQAQEYFFNCFGEEESSVIFSHGRLEIVGNHTDHNRGLVLCSGVDLGITAGIRKNGDDYVRICSSGYRPFDIDLDDLAMKEEEKGTSAALVRGVLAKMKEVGYKIGGFELAGVSDIYEGAGVSSSACFEALIVKAVSVLFNKDSVDPAAMAVISQYAENVYFGKPCGLLDQIGASFGGVAYVDFGPDKPEVELLSFPFALRLFLINAGGSHANLTHLYAEIPADMHAVARHIYGKDYLRQISREEYFSRLGTPCLAVSERAKMRSTHFFEENVRVSRARVAIKNRDEGTFINAINDSGFSSTVMLANTMANGVYAGSPQQVIDTVKPLMGPGGGIRIMGGGFAGSIIAFIPEERADAFARKVVSIYGSKAVREVKIVEKGPVEL